MPPRTKHLTAGAATEGEPATGAQPSAEKTYFDVVRSISKDPDVLQAVDRAEKASKDAAEKP